MSTNCSRSLVRTSKVCTFRAPAVASSSAACHDSRAPARAVSGQNRRIMADLKSIGNSAANVLFAASVIVWMYILWKARRRRPPLVQVPHTGVPWPALVVCATFLVALIVPQFVVGLRGPVDRFSVQAVQLACLSMALQGLSVVGVLRLAGPIRSEDFGLNPATWRGDLVVGLVAYLASLIPVSLVNAGVEKLELRGEGDKH